MDEGDNGEINADSGVGDFFADDLFRVAIGSGAGVGAAGSTCVLVADLGAGWPAAVSVRFLGGRPAPRLLPPLPDPGPPRRRSAVVPPPRGLLLLLCEVALEESSSLPLPPTFSFSFLSLSSFSVVRFTVSAVQPILVAKGLLAASCMTTSLSPLSLGSEAVSSSSSRLCMCLLGGERDNAGESDDAPESARRRRRIVGGVEGAIVVAAAVATSVGGGGVAMATSPSTFVTGCFCWALAAFSASVLFLLPRGLPGLRGVFVGVFGGADADGAAAAGTDVRVAVGD